jgi:hypothetical protein
MTPEAKKEVEEAIETVTTMIKRYRDSLHCTSPIADFSQCAVAIGFISRTITEQRQEIATLRADVEVRDRAMVILAKRDYPLNHPHVRGIVEHRIKAAIEAAKEEKQHDTRG